MKARHFILIAMLLIVATSCKIPDYTSDRGKGSETVPPVPDIYDDKGMAKTSPSDVVSYRLPDGYLLKIRTNDSAENILTETADGFSILLNPEGFYEYTIKDDQGLPQPTRIIARNPEDRTPEDWRILNSIP